MDIVNDDGKDIDVDRCELMEALEKNLSNLPLGYRLNLSQVKVEEL
jgi:hypothetical protein